MKVLVATNGSATAIDAAHRAIELLRGDAQITLATVIAEREDPMAAAGGFEGAAMTDEQAEQQYNQAETEGHAALERTAAAVPEGIEERIIAAEDEPGPAIVHFAEEMGAEVIVIGAEGKGALRRFFTGSVSDFVVHHAPCPVLVVRHDH